jgi:NAD(P)-dependent dehydrogenase (short-subunit alcohol dehydrogenase family)
MLIGHAGGPSPVACVVIDVDSDESIEAARADVEARFGRLDVLVVRTAAPRTRELLAKTYGTNVFGAAATTAAFLPLMLRAPHPRLVNVSSGLGSLSQMVDPTSQWAQAQALVRRARRVRADRAHARVGV